MKKGLRKTLRWTGYLVAAICLLGVLDVVALAYPVPAFQHQAELGNLTFYSDRELDSEYQRIIEDVAHRLRNVEIYDSTLNLRVFICQDQSRYNLFARMAMVPTTVPGFNLSLLDNSFVSIPKLKYRQERSAHFPPYSTIKGDIAHSITHELLHDYTVNKVGFFRNRNLPAWKTEGYNEYASSLVYSRSDNVATLSSRITAIMNLYTDRRTREYYTWGLVVEYLAEKENYRFADIMSDSVTYDRAHSQMINWYHDLTGNP